MAGYLAERVVRALLVLLGVIFVTYSLVMLTGDPVVAMMGPDTPPAMLEQARHDLGFDQPLPIQILRHVGRMLQGDFGRSSTYHQASFPLIVERLPATLALTLAAMAVNLLIALPLGVYSAVRRGGVVDWLGTGIVFAGQSMPIFWMGIVMILVFSLALRLLPASGFGWPNIIMP